MVTIYRWSLTYESVFQNYDVKLPHYTPSHYTLNYYLFREFDGSLRPYQNTRKASPEFWSNN